LKHSKEPAQYSPQQLGDVLRKQMPAGVSVQKLRDSLQMEHHKPV
jgi:hypothetical protein